MQLSRLSFAVALLVGLMSCADDTVTVDTSWALGSYSSVRDGVASSVLLNVEVDADGTVSFSYRMGCTGGDSPTKAVYAWAADGPDTIRITDRDGGLVEGETELWLTKTEACDRVMLQAPAGDEVADFMELHVGATCLAYIGPCEPGSGECDECRAQWCDMPPPIVRSRRLRVG